MSDPLMDDRRDRQSRRRFLAATGAVCATLLAGCSGDDSNSGGDSGGSSAGDGGSGGTATPDPMDDGGSMDDEDSTPDGGSMDDSSTDDGGSMSWQTTELTTVRGAETFTIAGLEGPVVVQSFAVWCPKCERQSKQLANVDDSVTVVGLNTDPNEDAAKVRDHAERNGFDWRFTVAPTEMTESLVEAFGPTVTNAPSTPVIVACPDGSTEFMSGSIQSAEVIETTASEC